MMKSNFNARHGDTLQNKSKHHKNIKPKASREFKSICGQALRLKAQGPSPFITANRSKYNVKHFK